MPYQYRREPLQRQESQALLDACQDDFEYVVICMLLETGMRVSELAELSEINVDWERRTITVYGKGGDRRLRYAPKGSRARKKRRILPLSQKAEPALKRYFARYGSIDKSARTLQRVVRRVALRANIRRPVTPHVLRHTFAVRGIKDKKISLPSMQRLLGHNYLTTTEGYLNFSPDDVLEEFRLQWDGEATAIHLT